MGKNSHIEWTHHTFNPWWGCAKVSPACQHCYAEALSKRFGGSTWGTRGERRFFSEAHWKEPERWNEEAKNFGKKYRVFCASMSDVFEDRRDLDSARTKLWKLIEKTESLDWLLLTKRPEKTTKLAPWISNWPENVWLGTTVESQEWADKRLPALLAVPARIRFLSCEPLLGPLDLTQYLKNRDLDWIIVGGESGPKARPTHPNWIRNLRDTSDKFGVAFHFKQWGKFAPSSPKSKKANIFTFPDGVTMVRGNKVMNGRTLDGKTHDGLPTL